MHAFGVRTGLGGLTAGWHPVRILYFHRNGEQKLEISWEGPGMDKHPLGAADVFYGKQ